MTSNSERDVFEKEYVRRYGPLDDRLRSGWHYADQLQTWQAATSHLMPAIKVARHALEATRGYVLEECVATGGASSKRTLSGADDALATLNAIIKE